jgi:ABC-type dipeptide/oligopeptide/nickel transport system ATPase subunit
VPSAALAIARAILHLPDYLFLDEATASLDKPAEAGIYQLLRQRLPQATIVSIGHRTTLNAFHDRHLSVFPHATATAFARAQRSGSRSQGSPDGCGLLERMPPVADVARARAAEPAMRAEDRRAHAHSRFGAHRVAATDRSA